MNPSSVDPSIQPSTGRVGRREWLIVAAVGLVVALFSLFVFPVREIPVSGSSWDVMQSGRWFAERGFLANQLQPRWAPPNDPAPFITYTHYPPLPFWIGGVVHSIVTDPQLRISTMMHLIRLVGVFALLTAYTLVRQLGVGVAAAALMTAMMAWSEWWLLVGGELSWCSWWPLFGLGAATAFVWGVKRHRSAWRIALTVALACCAAAALCAFDAWLWAPTFILALWCMTPRRAVPRRRRLLYAFVFTCAATGIGVTTRLMLNWWYFGSLGAVVRDLGQAYQWRSVAVLSGELTPENAVNYWVPSLQMSRTERTLLAMSGLPVRLARMYLPPGLPVWWIGGVTIGLALASWGMAIRGRRARGQSAWPNGLKTLIALAVAPLPFVLLLPSITIEQPFPLLAFGPAIALLLGLGFHGAMASIARVANALHARAGQGVTAVVVLAVVILVIVRLPQASGAAWRPPFEESRAAVQAVADIDGPLFVNVSETNPLMYLVPTGSRLALKPLGMASNAAFASIRPVRVLIIESLSLSRLQRQALEVAKTEQRTGLPPGWSLKWVDDPATMFPKVGPRSNVPKVGPRADF